MRAWWMLPAVGLVLAGCRTNGDRGEAAPPSGPRPGVTERGAVPSADEVTARVLASTRSIAQSEVDAAKLARERASSSSVKDYAVRAVAEQQAALDAISDLVKAKRIDLDAPGIQADPLLKAQKDAGKEALDKLRTLSGTAFDATYMTAQRPVQALLARTAQEGLGVTKDTEVGNVLRTIAQQAHDRTAKAATILPTTCGGERPGWG